MSENKNELEVKYEIDGNPIRLTFDIVQKFIVGNQANISLPEYKFFTELCKVRKLNPFMKEAYLIKYSDNDPAQLVAVSYTHLMCIRDSLYTFLRTMNILSKVD